MKKLELNDKLETILICAERYACGRESYMPSLVIGYITVWMWKSREMLV